MSDINEVLDGFLNTTLKNENLGKTAEKERQTIVELLQKLYSEYEYLNPCKADGGISSTSSDEIDGYETLEDVAAKVAEILNKQNPKPLPDLPLEKSNVPELESNLIYHDAESEKPSAASQAPLRKTQLPPIPSAPGPIDETSYSHDEMYETFDNVISKINMASSLLSFIPTSPSPVPSHEKVKDDVTPPPFSSRFQPSEKSVRELPPLPKRKRILTLGNGNLTENDYENMYCGKWKCMGLTKNELCFDKGDIIHVINRELDAENWWVGELKGQIGLVPKPFLCQAYEVVA